MTLRVTPQITEGDSLRLDIFQEITSINKALQADVGDVNEVGVPLASRKVENTVMVGDDETVVIGGLISDVYEDIGEQGARGSATSRSSAGPSRPRRAACSKINLLVFLTPHIVRTRARSRARDDPQARGVRERDRAVARALARTRSRRRRSAARRPRRPARSTRRRPAATRCATALLEQEARYPLERMHEIEQQQQADARTRARRGRQGRAALLRAGARRRRRERGDAGAHRAGRRRLRRHARLEPDRVGTGALRDPPRPLRDARRGAARGRRGAERARPQQLGARRARAPEEDEP